MKSFFALIALVSAVQIQPDTTFIMSGLSSGIGILAGETPQGRKFYSIPKPVVSIRFLSDSDDKLMNSLILDGYALVLEGDPMVSTDDSYCGCNCGCCFGVMAVGKT